MTLSTLSSTLRKYRVRALIGACVATPASADDGAPAGLEYKLTRSCYRASDCNDAADVNLRISAGVHTGRIGEYCDRNGFQQGNAGCEYRQDAGLAPNGAHRA